MRHDAIPLALLGFGLSALAFGAQPAFAQATVAPAPSLPPIATPAPVATPPAGGTPFPFFTPAPGAVPGATPTVAPGPPAGGTGVIDASQIPTLLPADASSPLPFPAYGTPAPSSPPHVVSGIPQIVTLQQAILIAYARSPLLSQARAQVAISSAPLSLAESALFPLVTGAASQSHSHRELATLSSAAIGTVVGNTTSPNTTTNSLDATLTQLIFDGGRVAAEIRSARATQQASVATYQRMLQTIAFNVATSYYNTLAAQRLTQVSQTTVQLDLVQENLVSAQIRSGTAPRSQLATVQLPTAQARVAVVRAQAAEKVQLATFANTLGLDAGAYVRPKDDVPALNALSGTLTVTPAFPTPSYDQAIVRAVALRPDLTAAQFNVVSFQQNLIFQRKGTFPTLNGTGSYDTISTGAGGSAFRNSASIGVTLTVPIYDRGVTRAQTALAQGQLDNSVALFQNTQATIQLNVQTALVNLVSAYAALGQTNAELATAQENLRSTEAQYAAGVTTLPLLLNAQLGITTALTDEVNAVYTVRLAEQALLFAEGANAAG
jgi:outer membrane protein